jgi:quinol monooxygenase YgiN
LYLSRQHAAEYGEWFVPFRAEKAGCKMIHVIATVRTAAGRRADFLAAFGQVVPLVRGEAGCLEYGAAVDLPTTIRAQAPVRDDVVTVIEKWDSMAALEAHLSAPHVLSYREKVKDLVAGLEIQVLEPAGA